MTVDNQLIMMEKYRLTAEEALLIELLFLASIEEGHSEYLVKYLSMPITRTDLRDLLCSLQNKGIITKQYKIPEKGQGFDPECVIFNQNFLHNYRKFSGDLGAEFYMTYPHNGIINGIEVPLNNWAKRFKTEEEFYYAYGKSIGWKLDKHNEVLELVKWAKDNNCNLLNMNMADFVVSKIWRNIAELKNGDSVMRFDTIKSI